MRWILEKILQLPRAEEGELVRALLLRFGFLDDETDAARKAIASGEKRLGSFEPATRDDERYEIWSRMYF